MWFKYIIREYINKQTSQIRRWFQIEHFFTHMTRDNRHIIKYSHHTGGATNQTQPWFYVQDLCFQIQSLTKERALLKNSIIIILPSDAAQNKTKNYNQLSLALTQGSCQRVLTRFYVAFDANLGSYSRRTHCKMIE